MYLLLPEWSMILRVRTIRISATVRATVHPAEKPEEQLHVTWRLFKTMNMCDNFSWRVREKHSFTHQNYTFFYAYLCNKHIKNWFTHGKCNPVPFSLWFRSQDAHSFISIWVGKVLNEYIFHPLHKPGELQGKVIHKTK